MDPYKAVSFLCERYGLWTSYFLLYRVRRKWCVRVIRTLLLFLLNKLWIRQDVAHSWERFPHICAEFGSSTLTSGLNLQRHETSSLPVQAKRTFVDKYICMHCIKMCSALDFVIVWLIMILKSIFPFSAEIISHCFIFQLK